METVGRRNGKKSFHKRKGFAYTLLFFAVMFFAGVGYYAYSFYDFVKSTSKPNPLSQTGEDWTGTERVNIALLGVDSRPGEGPPRADTMMVLSIDPQTRDVALFSIMRDTYYKVPGYGFRKINEAHALGGPELVVETLSKFMQIKIHYYVKTDFKGFENIVDVLGGINMYVEKNMYWPDDGPYDINLKKGQQHLNGKQALMYVRFRNDELGDYTRTERQRKFLATLAKELKTTNSLLKMPEILKAVSDDIETNMTFNDMMKLGKLAYNIDLASLDSVQLPPKMDSTGTKFALLDTQRDGASVIIPDLYETRLLVHKILNTGKTVVKTKDDQEPMVHETRPAQTATPSPKPDEAAPDSKTNGTGTKAGENTNSNDKTSGQSNSGTTKNGTGGSSSKPGGTTQGGSTGGSTPNGTGSTSGGSTGGNTSGATKPGDGTTGGSGGTNSGSGSTGSGSGGSSIVPIPVTP
ncbi:LCP family protein [Effusibacillus lacus]|uniref:Transcriptional regulator n=1 Tax=Effusibacillus lacus TaxID=1348429 RepID=A0A292YP38_9BACL|nr:LCP family protein [Effusibacillus lacus]TCS68052.1 LytR family transcriptional attenuator [Effusibacillus lacus]GAX90946.1 transcriptional regulator [Effusibacillus lacus]